MDKQAKKQRYYSIMIVPHDAQGRPISLKLPAWGVYLTLFVVGFSFVLTASSLVYSSLISRKLVTYTDTLVKSQEQQQTLNILGRKTSQVNQMLDELAQRDNELRRLLGLKSWQSKIKLSTDLPSAEAKSQKLTKELKTINLRIAENKASLNELKEWVGTVRAKFAQTPSIWPVNGKIVSGYGFRIHPWRGLHLGIDIDVDRGTPVKATADGTVIYASWRHGYGKTVEIGHGDGVSTLYAHNSDYAVKLGQKVTKGTIVAYVGSTGWTTGPHLHYEVRRWGVPVNPVAFLATDLKTASRLWR
ncbi:hypothetical protein A2311_02920 [candidate division WOR-1 bacterium RIFOXYB2_FULL_48_7]|uniref:M23ase beta-sheet core domain-containing protein n=1 Tax=candidate division WOR-1 bacterium RIFOXYB2_FULL_48_7 TaxID=1802583 RepID=A0A1F4TW06_UNCSA|nr:MAG: hypothetical protein A2311_02920 [candidate division WOR-1 bacterium RIFOXYB2_FULL_48_7]